MYDVITSYSIHYTKLYEKLMPELARYRKDLEGKKVAMYVGGSFKAFSLVKAFRHLGMKVVLVGSQTGTKDVITSYSIHYTKLYEEVRHHQHRHLLRQLFLRSVRLRPARRPQRRHVPPFV